MGIESSCRCSYLRRHTEAGTVQRTCLAHVVTFNTVMSHINTFNTFNTVISCNAEDVRSYKFTSFAAKEELSPTQSQLQAAERLVDALDLTQGTDCSVTNYPLYVCVESNACLGCSQPERLLHVRWQHTHVLPYIVSQPGLHCGCYTMYSPYPGSLPGGPRGKRGGGSLLASCPMPVLSIIASASLLQSFVLIPNTKQESLAH